MEHDRVSLSKINAMVLGIRVIFTVVAFIHKISYFKEISLTIYFILFSNVFVLLVKILKTTLFDFARFYNNARIA